MSNYPSAENLPEAARILADQIVARGGFGTSDSERIACARILARFMAEQRKEARDSLRAAVSA